MDTRLAVGVALVLASVLTGARVVSSAHRTYAAVAITHDAESGTVLGAADLRVVRVRLSQRNLYVAQPEVGIGKQLSRPLVRGELVPRSALGVPPPLTSLEVPLTDDAAPSLAPGERIAIWLSGARCPPVLVLSEVVVQSVRDSGASMGSSASQAIDISVTPSMADRVLAALSRPDSQLHAGVLTGSRTSDDTPLPAIECPGGGQDR